MKRLLLLIAIAVPAAFAFRAYVAEGIYIATPSMEPTLKVGRHLIVDKLTYRFRDPRRGEIVVFPSPVDPAKDLVKRVIAVEGDSIEIRRKQVSLNGQALEEIYTQFTRSQELLKGDNLGPLSVPKNSLFVMGDNRDESGDSRDWTDPAGERLYFIPVSSVKGTVIDFP